MKDMKSLAEHVNNLFNVDSPELVDVPELTRKEAQTLNDLFKQKYPGRYITQVSIEVTSNDDYTLSVRRKI